MVYMVLNDDSKHDVITSIYIYMIKPRFHQK